LLFAGLLTGLLTSLGFAALVFAFAAADFSNAGADISGVVNSDSVGSMSRRFNIVPLISRDCFLVGEM
jgi:zinc transporter ZupT